MRWLLAALGYLLLAIAVSWPLAARLDAALPGFPTVDAMDTVMLRGLAAEMIAAGSGETAHIYFPYGVPAAVMIPNWADHVTGMGLMRVLDFPASDGVWWLVVLSLNGLAGHRLGHQLGGSHGAGLLVGVGWAFSDSVLREANLHHAPQAMSFSTPLYLAALLRCTADDGRWRDGVAAGVWMAIAGITYWYGALFLAAASIPVVVARRLHGARRVALAAALSALLVAPALSATLSQWADLPRPPPAQGGPASEGRLAGVPADEVMEVDQSGDPLMAFRAAPMDRSNVIPIALLIAAGAAGWRARREPGGDGLRVAGAMLGVAGIGYAMALGPYLTWDGSPVAAGDRLIPLPFGWLGELHPGLDRLNWPQRWGILIPLGLAAAAARVPRPALFAALIGAEVLVRSANAPLQLNDLRHLSPWATLSSADGAVLELPLARGLRASAVGVNARYHGRPLVNPVLLPPGHRAPEGWQRWTKSQPILAAILRLETGGRAGSIDAPQSAADDLRAAGLGALALDVGPASGTTAARQAAYRALLDPIFGAPEDRGVALVWWIAPPAPAPAPFADPDAWRAEVTDWMSAHPPPSLDALIDTTWPAPGGAGSGKRPRGTQRERDPR